MLSCKIFVVRFCFSVLTLLYFDKVFHVSKLFGIGLALYNIETSESIATWRSMQ